MSCRHKHGSSEKSSACHSAFNNASTCSSSFELTQKLTEVGSTIAVDAQGNVYISNSSSFVASAAPSILKCDNKGKLVKNSSVTDENGKLKIAAGSYGTGGAPRGLQLGPDGYMYHLVSNAAGGAYVQRLNLVTLQSSTYATISTSSRILNDLQFDKQGNLYCTDSGTPSAPNVEAPLAGKIYKISPHSGNVEISSAWYSSNLITAPSVYRVTAGLFLGANGIAVDDKYVYTNNCDAGTLVRIAIRSDGAAGNAEVIAEDPRLIGADGMKLDKQGNFWIGNIYNDNVLLLKPNGELSTVSAPYPIFDSPISLIITKDTACETQMWVFNTGFFRAINSIPGVQGSLPGPAYIGLGNLTVRYSKEC